MSDSMGWVRILNGDGLDIAKLTPQVDRKLKRMVLYLTLPEEPTEELKAQIGKMGFIKATVKTPNGNLLFGSTQFSDDTHPTKLKFNGKISLMQETWPNIQFSARMSKKEVFFFDYGMKQYHDMMNQGATQGETNAVAQIQQALEPSEEEVPNRSVHFSISNAQRIGLNHKGEAVFELNSERFVHRDDEFISEMDLTQQGSFVPTDFIRASRYELHNQLEIIATGILQDAAANPSFNQGDLNRYLKAVAPSVPNDVIQSGEFVAGLNRGIKKSLSDEFSKAVPDSPTSYTDILPADDLIKRIPGAQNMFLTVPSITQGMVQAATSGVDSDKPRVTITNSGDGLPVFAALQQLDQAIIRVAMPNTSTHTSRYQRSRLNTFSFVDRSHERLREIRHNIAEDRLSDNSADLVFGVYPMATVSMATEGKRSTISFGDFETDLYEHASVLNSLNGLSELGIAALQLPSHGEDIDRALLDKVAQQYAIHGVARLQGPALFNGHDQLLLIAGDKKFIPDDSLTFEGNIPDKPTLEDAYVWLRSTGNRVKLSRLDAVTASAPASAASSSSLSNLSLSDLTNKLSRDNFIQVNPNQIKYTPITGVSKFADTRPIVYSRDLARPVAIAQAKLRNGVKKLDYESVTHYLADKLGYSVDDLKSEKHFSTNQQDNIAHAIYRHEEQGKPFIIGDGGGVGKTRQAAALTKYCLDRDIPVAFMSIQPTIFNKLIQEMAAIDAEHLLTGPEVDGVANVFVYNHDITVTDSQGNALARGDNGINGRLAKTRSMVRAKLSFLTTSQLNRPVKRKKNEKYADYKQRRADSKVALIERSFDIAAPFIILDESHTAAGQSNTNEVMEGLLPKGRGAVFMSATSVPTKRAYSLYRHALPASVSPEMLEIAISRGGNAIPQAVAIGLISDGAMSSLHLENKAETKVAKIEDLSQIALNERIADEFSAVFDYYTTLTGEVESALSEVVNITNAKRRGAGDNDEVDEITTHRELGFDTSHFGSQSSRVINMLGLALNTLQAGAAAQQEIKEGRRVFYTLQHTGQSLIDKVKAAKGVLPDGSFEQPTLKDLANHLLDNAEYVNHVEATGEVRKIHATENMKPKQASQFLKTMQDARKYVETKLTGLPVNPIDILRNELSSRGLRVGEISGRNEHGEYVSDSHIKIMPKSPDEYDKEKVIKQWQDGQLDVVIGTAAAATGNDMHPGQNHKDHRPVTTVIGEAFPNPTLWLQLLYRTYRYDQVALPRYIVLDNGLPVSKRMLENTMRKLGFVESARTGTTQTSYGIDGIYEQDVNIISDAGNKAVIRYLVNNPTTARKMGMYKEVAPYINDESKIIRYDANATIADRFMAHLMMRPSAEAKEILEDVIAETAAMLQEQKILGIDSTGGVQFMDIKGTEVSREVVRAGIPDPYNPDNAMMGDVVAKEIEYIENVKPISADQVLELVELGHETFESNPRLANGKLQELIDEMDNNKLKTIMDALPTADLNLALNASSDHERDSIVLEFIRTNKVSTAAYLSDVMDWLKKSLPLMQPGSIIKGVKVEDSFFEHDGVIVNLKTPRPGQEHNLSQWQFEVAVPGKERPMALSMLNLYRSATHDGFTLDEFDEHHSLADDFDSHKESNMKRRMVVLGGNLIESALLIHSVGGGSSITYTDESGAIHRGFKVSEKMSMKKLMSVPQIFTPEQAKGFIKESPRHEITSSSADYDPTKHVRISLNPKTYGVVLQSPRNKSFGEGYAVGTALVTDPRTGRESNMNPLEALTGQEWEFKKSFAIIEVPEHALESVLSYIDSRIEHNFESGLYGNQYSLSYLNKLAQQIETTLENESEQEHEAEQQAHMSA